MYSQEKMTLHIAKPNMRFIYGIYALPKNNMYRYISDSIGRHFACL